MSRRTEKPGPRQRRGLIIGLSSAAIVVGLTVGTVWWAALTPDIFRPAIARDLPGSFSAADHVFRARVREAFPLPVSVADLTDRAATMGFQVIPEEGRALFEQPGFPCRLIWIIRWDAADGAVTAVDASYRGLCL